jgi:hypothetical protein
MKTLYNWKKDGKKLITYLAIPKPTNFDILRSHKATYNPKNKIMEITDGTISTWFKIHNKNEAETILKSFRSTDVAMMSVGLIDNIRKEIR